MKIEVYTYSLRIINVTYQSETMDWLIFLSVVRTFVLVSMQDIFPRLTAWVQDIFLRLSAWVQDIFLRLSAWVQDIFLRLSAWVQDIPALAERRILNKLPSPISAIILVLLIVVVYIVYNVTVWLAPKLRIVVCYLLPCVFIVMFLYNLGHHN